MARYPRLTIFPTFDPLSTFNPSPAALKKNCGTAYVHIELRGSVDSICLYLAAGQYLFCTQSFWLPSDIDEVEYQNSKSSYCPKNSILSTTFSRFVFKVLILAEVLDLKKLNQNLSRPLLSSQFQRVICISFRDFNFITIKNESESRH